MRGLTALRLSTFLLLAPASVASGPVQVPRPIDTWNHVDVYLDDARLEDVAIFHVAFEEDGTGWFSTSDGLVHYDGYAWTRLGVEHGLPSSYVRCACVTPEGLWVGTDRGAVLFDTQAMEVLRQAEGLAGASVRRIVRGPDGVLWFCSDLWPHGRGRGGLARRDLDGSWQSWSHEQEPAFDYVSDVVPAEDGGAWVMARTGLVRLTADGLLETERQVPWQGNYVWGLARSPDGGWLISTTGGLYAKAPGGWSALTRPDMLRNPPLLETRTGEVFALGLAGGTATFLRWSGEEFEEVVDCRESRALDVQALVEAPDGSIWAVGMGLLLRLQRRSREWQSFSGLAPPRLVDSEQAIWFLGEGDGDVWRRRGETWSHEGRGRRPIVETPPGSVWFHSADELVRREAGAEERFTEEVIGLRPTHGPIIDGGGALWVAGPASSGALGAAHLRDGRWLVLSLEAAPTERLAKLAPATGSGVFAVLRDSLSMATRLLWIELDPPEEGQVRALAELPPAFQDKLELQLFADQGSILWAHGLAGLLRLDAPWSGEWETVVLPRGHHVSQMLRWRGDLWIATLGTTGGAGGIVRLREGRFEVFSPAVQDLIRVPGSPPILVGASRLMVLEGDLPRQVGLTLEARVSAALLAPNGSLWLGTSDGVTRFRPDGIPPRTLVRSELASLVEGDSLRLEVAGIERFRPVDSSRFLLFRTRTDAGPWSAPRPATEGALDLGRLPVGKHEVLVQVIDEGGDADPEPPRVTVTVLPTPLQQRAWFLPLTAAIITLLTILVAGTARARGRVTRLARELERRVELRTFELRTSESRYRSLFEHSLDAVLVLDHEGVVLTANEPARQLLGLQDEFAPFPVTRLLADPEAPALRTALARSEPLPETETRVIGDGGRVFEALLAGTPALDHEGAPSFAMQVILRDISERRSLEKKLLQSQKLEAVGLLAGGVAHDFNNILVGVRGHVALAADSAAAQSDTEIREHLDQVGYAVDRATALTRRLLALGRHEVARPRPLDLDRVLQDLEPLLRRLLREDIRLDVHAAGNLPPVVADDGQIEQILLNLAVNASDAMSNGGVLTITTGTRRRKGAGLQRLFVTLRVEDTGCGMDEETLGRAFEPFFTTKSPGRGTGLGLATVQSIVASSKGRIEIASRPGKGTRIGILFPACERDRQPEPESPPPAAARPAAQGERILVCEDDGMIRELMIRILESGGYRVTACDAPAAALASGVTPDLLVTDVVLPGMNGRDLARRLTARHFGLPVLYISGYSADILADRGVLLPGIELLQKPFAPSDLLQRVRSLLDRRDSRSRTPAS